MNPRLPDGGIFIGIFIGDSFFQLAVLPAHSFVVIISVSSRSGAGKDALPTDRAAVGRLRARVREGGATEEALRAPWKASGSLLQSSLGTPLELFGKLSEKEL